jgi:hypothetical protein
VSAGGSDRDVIFEITRVGDVQRIAAIDVATGVEVVVQAPASAALADVRALALKKLERVLTEQPQTPKRPGTLA